MSSITVRVNQGIVRGCQEDLPDGKKFLRFSGIPYAKPPINELRFKSPVKLLKFDQDEIDCTMERDACFHKSTLTRDYIGSEDCLNLNVYVPCITKPRQNFAVMIFIHGGALKYDSNSRTLFSPEPLLMEDVIVVTINYRLHVLGFMSLPSMGISGNAGLKDQQMALEWVHENISNFNGDPNRICLFGESAGAACTHLHVLNAKSRQFIKTAICQSGTAFAENSFRGNTEKDVRHVAKLLGCKSVELKDAYDTLLNAPLRDLYDKCEADPSPAEQNFRFRRWRLVIEEDSKDAFVSKSSIASIIDQKGQINVPIMMGTNDADGLPRVAQNLKKLKELNDNMTSTLPKSFVLNPNESKLMASEIKRFYFGDQDVCEKTLPQLSTMFTDLVYLNYQTIGNEFSAQFQPQGKQFLYEFQFVGRLNIQKKLVKLEYLPGACHNDDVFYFFGGELANKVKFEENSRELKMRRMMCKLWTNFAKFEDPTPDHANPLPFKWNPVEAFDESRQINFDYLVLNDDIKMVKNLNKNRMDFWRYAYKRWGNNKIPSQSKL